MNTNPHKPDARRRDLAKIHVAKKQLALSEEDYRALLWTVARVKSSADLDAHGRRRVIQHMESRGFRPRRRRHPRPAGDRAPMLAKIRAMLAAEGRPDAYGDALARRIAKTERLEWCAPDGLRKIIAALNYDRRRKGNQQ